MIMIALFDLRSSSEAHVHFPSLPRVLIVLISEDYTVSYSMAQQCNMNVKSLLAGAATAAAASHLAQGLPLVVERRNCCTKNSQKKKFK